jgi:hypothetical protein
MPLALDDSGTGDSSLQYLQQLPLTRLKIDRALVGDLPDSRTDEASVRAVISMAQTLGMRVGTEGGQKPRTARGPRLPQAAGPPVQPAGVVRRNCRPSRSTLQWSHSMKMVPLVICLAAALPWVAAPVLAADAARDLGQLSLEDLMQFEVTSVSKKPQ